MARYDDYRTIARQDKRATATRAARQEIEDAHDAYLAARERWDDAPYQSDEDREAYAAYKAARDRLYDLDPRHSVFTG